VTNIVDSVDGSIRSLVWNRSPLNSESICGRAHGPVRKKPATETAPLACEDQVSVTKVSSAFRLSPRQTGTKSH
jgi:hypothetical protein